MTDEMRAVDVPDRFVIPLRALQCTGRDAGNQDRLVFARSRQKNDDRYLHAFGKQLVVPGSEHILVFHDILGDGGQHDFEIEYR